ncbi:MAG: GNAT family N-acetyltransferase [Oscillospiraceae bacterium]|nr:GNAT family N-acetyltransferase [Oscillospiraceae bacterium]
MDVREYLQDPCGKLSVPYWKAVSMVMPGDVKILHCSEWNGQYENYRRFFRLRHDLRDLAPLDFDCDTISMDWQAAELAGMINASYEDQGITVSVSDIMGWKERPTFREELCVYINAEGGRMAASGIAEYDEVCREGSIEWVQVLPEYRRRGLGKKIVSVLLNRLRDMGAGFATVSGDLDSRSEPLRLYRKCGFAGDDVWYICMV